MPVVRGIEAFFADFAEYAARQTNRKQAEQLESSLEFLRRVYL